jgi:hypothetical protein
MNDRETLKSSILQIDSIMLSVGHDMKLIKGLSQIEIYLLVLDAQKKIYADFGLPMLSQRTLDVITEIIFERGQHPKGK